MFGIKKITIATLAVAIGMPAMSLAATIIEERVVMPVVTEETTVITPVVEETITAPLVRKVTPVLIKEEVSIKPTSVTLTLSQEQRRSNFEKRIANLDTWIDLGATKGMLSADQVSAFKAEVERLKAMPFSLVSADGTYNLAMDHQLEKDINVLNASISTSMTKNSLAGAGLLQ